MTLNLNDEIKQIRPITASFNNNTICDLVENTWTEWVVYNDKQIKLKWNYFEDSNFIIQIHDKQALKDEESPDANYVYYVHLQKVTGKDLNGYNFELQEIKILSLSPDERRKLISQLTIETGIDTKITKETLTNYPFKKVLPGLSLINDLGVELQESDFYKVNYTPPLPQNEIFEGIEYFGIIPETLIKAKKYFVPYTYYFDSFDKKYLLEAVRIVNSFSIQSNLAITKRELSFKEKLFSIADMFLVIDKAFENRKQPHENNKKQPVIEHYFASKKENYFEMGMKLIDLQKYSESIIYFNKSIKKDPFHALAWYKKGLAYFKTRNWVEALSSFNKSIDIDPYFEDSYYFRGVIYFALNKCKDACNELQQAILLNSSTYHFYSALASIHMKMSNYSEAIENLDKAIILSQTEDLYCQRANAYYLLNMRYKSIADYTTVLNLNHKNKNAISNIVGLAQMLDDNDKQLEICNLVLKYEPSNYWANIKLVQFKIEAKEYDDARQLITDLEKDFSEDIPFLELKVALQLRSGKKAKETFAQIRKLMHQKNNYEPFSLIERNYKNTKLYANFRHKLWEWITFFENDSYN